ncbi:MAG: hypothetical protein ABL925_05995 [Methylococcales bacterium]
MKIAQRLAAKWLKQLLTASKCSLAVLLLLPISFNVAAVYNSTKCTAQIKAKNTSPKHKLKIDTLSTALGPVYVYSARSPSKPHRVINNDGNFETWTVELDSEWVDDNGTGCAGNHRVKVDLIRDSHLCENVKFPYSNAEPSDAKDSFVNTSKGGAVFSIGDLQKAYEDCLADPHCDCNGPQNK